MERRLAAILATDAPPNFLGLKRNPSRAGGKIRHRLRQLILRV